MTLSKNQQIFTQNIAKLIVHAKTLGIALTFGEAYRTKDQQWLYFNGKSIKNNQLTDTTPHSWTMQSNHLRRLAVDFNFFIKGELTYNRHEQLLIELGKYWESMNPANRWGGFWKHHDVPHFEMNIKQ